MRQYSRLVDRAIRPVVAGLGVPLILAGVEPLASIYRSVNSYPALAAELAQVRELFDARVSQGGARPT